MITSIYFRGTHREKKRNVMGKKWKKTITVSSSTALRLFFFCLVPDVECGADACLCVRNRNQRDGGCQHLYCRKTFRYPTNSYFSQFAHTHIHAHKRKNTTTTTRYRRSQNHHPPATKQQNERDKKKTVDISICKHAFRIPFHLQSILIHNMLKHHNSRDLCSENRL